LVDPLSMLILIHIRILWGNSLPVSFLGFLELVSHSISPRTVGTELENFDGDVARLGSYRNHGDQAGGARADHGEVIRLVIHYEQHISVWR
jgi:hypothetical protein